MYQLLKLRGISLHNIRVVPVPVIGSEQTKKCSLCNQFVSSYVLQGTLMKLSPTVRSSSTSISPVFLTEDKRKKKYRRRKKYTELLEVSEHNTAQKKATVRKLGSRNLSLFTGDVTNVPDNAPISSGCDLISELVTKEEKEIELKAVKRTKVLLEELEELDEETCANRALLETMPLSDSDIQKTLLEEYSAEESPVVTTQQLKKQKGNLTMKMSDKEKVAKVKYTELEKAGREKSLNTSLITFLELCANCGITNRGLGTLQHYLNKKGEAAFKDVKVFDKLLEGFARSGNVEKFEEVLKIMEKYNVAPSISSFKFYLETIARSKKPNKNVLTEGVLRQMEEAGHSVNELFTCQWKGDSKEVVLRAIHGARSTFKPFIPTPDIGYTCGLLKHLNVINSENLKSPAEEMFSEKNICDMFKEQLNMEMNFFLDVKSIEKISDSTKNVQHYRKKLDSLNVHWERSIMAALNRDLSSMNTLYKNLHNNFKQLNVYPYLIVLDKKDYKDIIMHEIRKLAEGSETFSPTANQLYRDIGNQVKLRYEMKLKSDSGVLKKVEVIYKDYSKWYLNPRGGNCNNCRQKWQLLAHEHWNGPSLEYDTHPWPQTVLHGIGKVLYNIIMRDIKIDVNIFRTGHKEAHYLPAFYSVFRHQGHITKEEVKPHPVLSRLFRAAAVQTLTFNITEVPMLTPPIPWTSLNSGGYLIAKTSLIRLPHQAIQQWERLNESPKAQIYPAFDSLNQLSSIPWKVNKPVLDTVIKVFNDGGCSKLDIPEPPSSCPVLDPITPDMTKIERFQAYRQRMIMRRRKAEMYSLWCDALYRLSLANHFRDRIFWLPHNMDFRGRVYPCPPHLNHLGSDMARSLLTFAKGKPLGPDGLDWLKIHLVNLTGLKKRDSVATRLAFANEILSDILDSANNPLDGKRWWAESDEPWQTLACCMEIRDALACQDGVEAFISHFPVHQDGSCNGLQHYAALGRDTAGAYSVNLAPSDLPQDVYSCVAALVERERSNDAAEGVKVAKVLEGFVRRKVIKQTVMTTVYGVTRFGARLQIAKQLKDIDDFPKDFVWPASTYLVTKTFASLREMFTSTREIQDWFTESARMISQVCGQNVEYVTPLGLPVVQPYYRYHRILECKKNAITGNFQEHYAMDMYERPNVMKQKNAFPPNFIHSLDSTHMMLTSLHCEQAGITFVSVHDCFWTHPCSIHIMNKICREQFVALHSEPILTDLSKFMLNKYGYSEENYTSDPEPVASAKQRLNSLLRELPSTGDFELKNVLNSVYFFS